MRNRTFNTCQVRIKTTARRCAEAPYPLFNHSRSLRSGFSLVELIVVIAVAVMLTGLLMPAMRQLHENAHRVMCLANLQQLGEGFILYGADHSERLPYSAALHEDNSPQNLMASRRGSPRGGWDGIGILYNEYYCRSSQCYYCPSHHGGHPYERYADQWQSEVDVSIFTNYHYAGDVEWAPGQLKRTLLEGHALVLATDGLKTAQDFNHTYGMNVLRADGSARWRDDTAGILQQLPANDAEPPQSDYGDLWDVVEEQ